MNEFLVHLLLAWGGVAVVFTILLIIVVKKQNKHANSLEVGDVVNYNGKPAKILEIKNGKARVETTMSLMQAGDKIDTEEYKFE